MKLRIAVWYNLNNGGSKRAFYDQVRGLAKRGHYIEAWCPPTAERSYLPIAPFVAKEHIVPMPAFPGRAGGPIGKRRHFALETSGQAAAIEAHSDECARQIRDGGFDILLAHPCKHFSTSAIGSKCDLPKILYLQEPYRPLHEAIPDLVWLAPEPPQGSFLSRWNQVITEACLTHGRRAQIRNEVKWAKAYDQVLVNSLFSRESVMRSYNIDARVCYLGIDTHEFKVIDARKEKYVIGLGNLKFNKRPVLAIEAVGAIPAAQRPRLVWVSNANTDSEVQAAESKARECGVQFELKTMVTEEQLHELLSRAAVLLYTSKLEPFGYAPLEANACGTGVVGIAEGGIRETVAHPDSGVLVSGSDPEAFAREIVKFTSDLAFAAEFGRRARAYVETNWAMPASIDRIEAELFRVIHRKKAVR